MKLRVTIVGAGALARALVEALPSSRVALTIAARRPAEARRLAKLSKGAMARDRAEAVLKAQVVVLAVDDRALPVVAREIAPLRRSWRGVVVLHAAGGVPVSALSPLARLAGASARIAGAPKAVAAAKRLAAWTGLLALPRRRSERRLDVDLHHAAAALCTGDVLALLTLAEDALHASGVPRPAARRAALSAAAATLDRIRRLGPEATLSGPVARGDLPRLLRHLEALASVHPAAAPAHRALTLRLVDLAVAAGALTRAGARSFRGLPRSSTV